MGGFPGQCSRSSLAPRSDALTTAPDESLDRTATWSGAVGSRWLIRHVYTKGPIRCALLSGSRVQRTPRRRESAVVTHLQRTNKHGDLHDGQGEAASRSHRPASTAPDFANPHPPASRVPLRACALARCRRCRTSCNCGFAQPVLTDDERPVPVPIHPPPCCAFVPNYTSAGPLSSLFSDADPPHLLMHIRADPSTPCFSTRSDSPCPPMRDL